MGILIGINAAVISILGIVAVYSLALGLYDLVVSVKSSRALKAKELMQLGLDADYERVFYADVFENILLDNSYQLPRECRVALSSYVDGVRNSKVVR